MTDEPFIGLHLPPAELRDLEPHHDDRPVLVLAGDERSGLVVRQMERLLGAMSPHIHCLTLPEALHRELREAEDRRLRDEQAPRFHERLDAGEVLHHLTIQPIELPPTIVDPCTRRPRPPRTHRKPPFCVNWATAPRSPMAPPTLREEIDAFLYALSPDGPDGLDSTPVNDSARATLLLARAVLAVEETLRAQRAPAAVSRLQAMATAAAVYCEVHGDKGPAPLQVAADRLERILAREDRIITIADRAGLAVLRSLGFSPTS